MQKKSLPSVAIIILNYNGGKMLEKAVSSVKVDGYPNAQVIVVDNASSDGSDQFVKDKFPEIVLINNSENYLFCKGCNIGMEYALSNDFDFVFLLNNDAQLKRGCLQTLVDFLEKNPDAAACQPLLVFEHRQDIIQSAGCRLSLSGLAWDHLCGEPVETAGDSPLNVLGVTGGAMLVRSDILREIGLFAEEFEMYFEDVDLSLRMRSAGWEVYCVPAARVSHIRCATSEKMGITRRNFYCERNSYYILKKHMHPAISMILSLAKAILSIAYHLFTQLTGNHNDHSIKALKEGLFNTSISTYTPRALTIYKKIDYTIFPPYCITPKKDP